MARENAQIAYPNGSIHNLEVRKVKEGVKLREDGNQQPQDSEKKNKIKVNVVYGEASLVECMKNVIIGKNH